MAAQATATAQAHSTAPRSGKPFNRKPVPVAVSHVTLTLTFRQKTKNGITKVLATANEGSRVVTYYPDRKESRPPLNVAMDCEVIDQTTANDAFAIRIVKVLGPSESARLAAITTSAAAAAKATMAAINPQPKAEEVVDQLIAAAMPAAAAEPVPVAEKIVAPEVHETPGQPKAADQTPAPAPEKTTEPSKPKKKFTSKDGKVFNDKGRSPRGKRGGASAVDPIRAEMEAMGLM